MPVIKRYPNRKLYDTEAKQYVNLSEIAAMIREGKSVQVLDHTTGKDLTAVTLAQIISDQEKQDRGFLPQTVLAGLIQAGGERLGTLRRALASPLELARHVDEEIERRVQALVERGELATEEGRHLLDKLLAHKPRAAGPTWLRGEDVEQALAERGVPTRDELQQLNAKLDRLLAELEELGPDQGPA